MKNILSLVSKWLTALTNTLPTKLVERLGHDKLAHGFLTAYVVSVCEYFGLLGGILGCLAMMGLGYLRERNEQPDYKDVLWMGVFGVLELLRYIIFE